MESKRRDLFLDFHQKAIKLWELVRHLTKESTRMIAIIKECQTSGAITTIDSFCEGMKGAGNKIKMRDEEFFPFVSSLDDKEKNILWNLMGEMEKICVLWQHLHKSSQMYR